MAKELFFSGGELELLAAMDRTGCVLTDDGKFTWDPEKCGMAFGSRVPVKIRGTYAPADGVWKITYRVIPAKKTVLIGILYLAVLLCCLLVGSYRSTILFVILNVAMVVNYVPQNKETLKRFENAFKK